MLGGADKIELHGTDPHKGFVMPTLLVADDADSLAHVHKHEGVWSGRDRDSLSAIPNICLRWLHRGKEAWLQAYTATTKPSKMTA